MNIKELKQQYSRKQLWEHTKPRFVNAACRLLDIELFEKQGVIVADSHRIKIIRSARRTSKSFTTAFITYCMLLFAAAFDYPLQIKFTGPRAEDTQHTWDHLYKFMDIAPIPGLEVVYSNRQSKATNKRELAFSNGTWIRSASCDSPEMNDIRGDAHDFIVVDEFGQVRYKEQLLDAALYSIKDEEPLNCLMIVGTADVVGMGTTFQRLYDLGQKPADVCLSCWKKGKGREQ